MLMEFFILLANRLTEVIYKIVIYQIKKIIFRKSRNAYWRIRSSEVSLDTEISLEIKSVKVSNIIRVNEITMLPLKKLDIGNKKTSVNQ